MIVNGLGKLYIDPSAPKKTTFLGRLARKLYGLAANAVKQAVPLGLGAEIVEQIEKIGNIGDWANQRLALDENGYSNYEPTPAEEAIIGSFMQTRFNPFFTNVVKELDRGMASPDVDSQMAAINIALSKMCVVMSHFRYNDADGLSPDALKYRWDGIRSMMEAIDNVVFKILDENPGYFIQSPARITASPADFAPFSIPAATYDCQNYVELGKDTAGNDVPVVPVSTTPNGTVVQPVTPATPGTTAGNGNTPGNGKGGKLLFLLLAGWGVYELLKPAKKKKEYSQT